VLSKVGVNGFNQIFNALKAFAHNSSLGDRQGNVVTAYEGFTDQATFESVIVPLLENTQG
jgi:hypothetical protein